MNIILDDNERSEPQLGDICILPGCTYNTLMCGMYNHFTYHQSPHHSISHIDATKLHQDWVIQQKEGLRDEMLDPIQNLTGLPFEGQEEDQVQAYTGNIRCILI